ncbi:hypothetical protein A6R68_00840 [Neotoma lepida]|uniref:Uncharacterized protein n=1 Tax=Neotoma lepida TaxID=56216 RepID=A0A1A6GYD1_NEOLE|nr:hypothetical protein A6R68_00840 [Neotoma lepida]
MRSSVAKQGAKRTSHLGSPALATGTGAEPSPWQPEYMKNEHEGMAAVDPTGTSLPVVLGSSVQRLQELKHLWQLLADILQLRRVQMSPFHMFTKKMNSSSCLMPAVHLQLRGNQGKVWTAWPANNRNMQRRWLEVDHEMAVHQAEAKLREQ